MNYLSIRCFLKKTSTILRQNEEKKVLFVELKKTQECCLFAQMTPPFPLLPHFLIKLKLLMFSRLGFTLNIFTKEHCLID